MRFLLTLSLVLASVPALAQEVRGPYVGLGLGVLDYKDGFLNRLDYDDTLSNVNIRAGFRFSEKMSFEGVYGQSDSFNLHKSGTINNFLANGGVIVGGEFDARLSGDLDYFEARVLAHAKHVVFGLGYFEVNISGNMTGTSQYSSMSQPAGTMFGTSLSDTEHGYEVLIGGQWDITDNWAIRAEYDYFDMSGPTDLTGFGVGIQYGF